MCCRGQSVSVLLAFNKPFALVQLSREFLHVRIFVVSSDFPSRSSSILAEIFWHFSIFSSHHRHFIHVRQQWKTRSPDPMPRERHTLHPVYKCTVPIPAAATTSLIYRIQPAAMGRFPAGGRSDMVQPTEMARHSESHMHALMLQILWHFLCQSATHMSNSIFKAIYKRLKVCKWYEYYFISWGGHQDWPWHDPSGSWHQERGKNHWKSHPVALVFLLHERMQLHRCILVCIFFCLTKPPPP